MVVPELSLMNINHRYYSIETFFKAAGEAGYRNIELWTGSMHLYVDCHEHDSVDKIRDLAAQYGIKIVCVCPEQNNPKPWNVAVRGEAGQKRILSYFKNVIDVAVELGVPQILVTSGWAYLDEPAEDAWSRSVAMLRSVGEDDVTESRMALPILLAIGWGSGIGGFGSPIGSSANLVAVSYIEKLTGHEFMYYDWVIRFLPLLAIVFLLNLIFLWLIPAPAKDLPGTRAYFREMYSKFGTMRRGEKIGLYLFILATALAFIRPLFASFLPAMKPAYVFLVIGMLMFFLRDENGKTMLDWQYAESHAM